MNSQCLIGREVACCSSCYCVSTLQMALTCLILPMMAKANTQQEDKNAHKCLIHHQGGLYISAGTCSHDGCSLLVI